jgi:hypothetical protein
MKCDNLQENLALYVDEILDIKTYGHLDKHLSECQTCQNKLAEYQSLQINLRSLARPSIPNDIAFSLQSVVSLELSRSKKQIFFSFSPDNLEFLKFKVMPYAVGTVASLIFSFSLLYFLLLAQTNFENSKEIAQNSTNSTIELALPQSRLAKKSDSTISAREFASKRLSVSGESPSVNPSGALISLATSMAGGQMSEREVVVVADVYRNGLAKISQIVEAPKGDNTIADLEKALSNDPDFAPFVPAEFDQRADSLRIVLKIQNVNIPTDAP